MVLAAEKVRQKLLKADFTDDVMFGMAMARFRFCKRFLQAVLPKYNFDHIELIPQKYLKSSYVTRAGRLDLLCTNENGDQFNVELQIVDEHNLAQRSRYYHALITNNMLAAGVDYQALRETWVIFLCAFDYLSLGLASDYFQMLSHYADYHALGDGSHTVVLNAKGNWSEVSDELKGIFQLVLKQKATYGCLGPDIAREIADIKQNKLEGEKYMALTGEFWQDAIDEGRYEGIKEGRVAERSAMLPIFIKKLIKDGQSQSEVIAYLESDFGLGKEEAQEYYQLAMAKA